MDFMKCAVLAFLLLTATAASAQQPARDAIGSVVIQRGSGPASFILIAIDAFGQGGRNDGAIDYVYKFYTDTEAPDLHYAFQVAHIDDFDGQVVVISAPVEKIRLTFANNDQRVSPRASSDGTEFLFTNGIGITREWGPRVARRMRNSGPVPSIGCQGEQGAECFNDWGDSGGGGSTCDAGGCPATSCSVTNRSLTCSVGCPAGKCACCNYGSLTANPSCKCQ